MNLDNLKEFSKIDKENMLDLLVSFPKQCEDALFIGERSRIKLSYKKRYSNIVFTGVGGSAIGADIVKGYVGGEIDIPIFINRDYTIPGFVNKNSLVFTISYSGNTEETLSAYKEVKKSRANIVAITSGGKLKELALKNNDMLIMIPKGYPPRCALGYSFIPVIAALWEIGLIKNKKDEIKSSARFLDDLQKKHLAPAVKGKVNLSKELAKKVHKRFPAIYTSNRMEPVATRWRGQFAENSKVLSSQHVFPEMNHNEIMGWVNPRVLLKEFVAVILKDKDDLPRIRKRMEITASILRKEEFSVLEIESRGKGFLERILSLIYIGDFASFYLSILNRIDPTPVDRIVYLKKQLAK
ncbi:MAG: bifunctional phosphoglucose/phosphomannose isomerase [Candidatus Omnitrophota bacterium]|nr:MAG: bifunctional phosphoglucose/phosphomannose isomerase [Candidatus Omnitrophota bacterium]